MIVAGTPRLVASPPESGDQPDLLDWKRHVLALYESVRASPDSRGASDLWRTTGDRLFRHHPQSPLPAERRTASIACDYFDYNPPPDAEKAEKAHGGAGLTGREAEILRLVERGMTDPRSPARSSSAGTVHAHVRSIYRKLDVRTRAAATRYALEHDLG